MRVKAAVNCKICFRSCKVWDWIRHQAKVFNFQVTHRVFLSSRLNSENRRIKTLRSSLGWSVSSSTTSRGPMLKVYELHCTEHMWVSTEAAATLIKQPTQIPSSQSQFRKDIMFHAVFEVRDAVCIFLLCSCTDVLFYFGDWMWLIEQADSMKRTVTLMHLDDGVTTSVGINSVNIKLIHATLFHVRGSFDLGRLQAYWIFVLRWIGNEGFQSSAGMLKCAADTRSSALAEEQNRHHFRGQLRLVYFGCVIILNMQSCCGQGHFLSQLSRRSSKAASD